jgi:hypothetical protein
MILNSTQNPSHTGHWRGIFFDGPQADTNHEGDEIPVWLGYVGDLLGIVCLISKSTLRK